MFLYCTVIMEDDKEGEVESKTPYVHQLPEEPVVTPKVTITDIVVKDKKDIDNEKECIDNKGVWLYNQCVD